MVVVLADENRGVVHFEDCLPRHLPFAAGLFDWN